MQAIDVLQAASNAVAGNVTGPVDILSLLLRKIGVPVPENALGSSQWAREQGLLRDVDDPYARAAGESLGIIAPMVAAAKAPQIARGLLKAGDNLAAPRTLDPQTGAIVWHGSPHKFDKFDSSKIGTGEGAQAYGHGLYVADSPKVAESYGMVLGGGKTYTLNGKPVRLANMSPAEQRAMQALTDLQSYGPTKEAYLTRLLDQDADPKFVDKISKAWDRLAAQSPASAIDKGNLYKVDLPDEAIARMLDWDAPLSQQGTIKKSLQVADDPNLKWANSWANPYFSESDAFTGARLIDSLKSRGVAEASTAALRRAGIPGIRYLDGGSRGAGTGTSNYVIFPQEEGLLTILERNGVPLR